MVSKRTLSAAALAGLLGVAGCGESDDAPADAAVETEQPRETVFDPLTSTVDRAEDVQGTVDAQSEELRRRVEEAEQ
jgi:ABC-type phosphate/phosphonate transport system substrate-binding protein